MRRELLNQPVVRQEGRPLWQKIMSVGALVTGLTYAGTVGEITSTDAVVASVTSTSIETTSSLAESTSSSVTTIPETTTTTTEALPVWRSYVYQENDCSHGQTLKVDVAGEDGKAVTALIGLDYVIGENKTKVDENGNIKDDPFSGYSKIVIINPDLSPEGSVEGTRLICLENVPLNVLVYAEAYKKDNINGELLSTHRWYGDASAAPYYAGPGQEMNIRLPIVNGPNGSGSTGNIFVNSFSHEAQSIEPTRLVAWGEGQRPVTETRGFAVADANQTGGASERELTALISGQTYLLQVESGAVQDALVAVSGVPVQPNQDTQVAIVSSESSCQAEATTNGQTMVLPCNVNQRIG